MGPTINLEPLIIKGFRAISPFFCTNKTAVTLVTAVLFMMGLEQDG